MMSPLITQRSPQGFTASSNEKLHRMEKWIDTAHCEVSNVANIKLPRMRVKPKILRRLSDRQAP